MAHLRLLIASFLPWALVLWASLFVSSVNASQLSARGFSGLIETSDLPFRLFKRRRGGDSDSDSSGSSSGGGSSGGYDDDDDDDSSSSSSGSGSGCTTTQQCIRSNYGYGKFYSSGAGRYGFIPPRLGGWPGSINTNQQRTVSAAQPEAIRLMAPAIRPDGSTTTTTAYGSTKMASSTRRARATAKGGTTAARRCPTSLAKSLPAASSPSVST